MLIVHHLGKSQSERIVWLCEEMEIPYELKLYARDAVTRLAPPEYAALHPIGAAPVITDGDLVLAESGAIMEYIIARYGSGRLALSPDHEAFADYLYWLHFANGTLQPAMSRAMVAGRINPPPGNPTVAFVQARLERAIGAVEARLQHSTYLAGEDFTAADIMLVFSFTTMRLFLPVDLGPYRHIRSYLQRIGARPAYQAAMRKSDPDMTPILT